MAITGLPGGGPNHVGGRVPYMTLQAPELEGSFTLCYCAGGDSGRQMAEPCEAGTKGDWSAGRAGNVSLPEFRFGL